MTRTLALTTIAIAWTSTAARADLVNLIPGSTIKAPGGVVRGTVTAESPTSVTVRVGNADQIVPVGQIASIRYDGRPPSLDFAAAREASGNLAEAADQYKKAATEAATKPFIVADALFGQARATADLGLTDPSKTAAAIALLESFLKMNGNGRHVIPALESLAKLQLQKGSYDAVDKTIAQLAAIPQTADRAALLRAKVGTRKGDHETAVSELDRLISTAPEGSAKRRDAQLAKAESLVALKKYAEAETLVRGVIGGAAPEDSATQAVAYNTLGDCLRAAGRPKDAIYAYLHVDLLFFKEKDQHPKALARIVEIWRALKRRPRRRSPRTTQAGIPQESLRRERIDQDERLRPTGRNEKSLAST